jgi:uncharacterized protein (TIGR03086 family)
VTDRPSGPGSPWGGVELLERAVAYTRGSLALVRPELMGAPTPCDRWSLHDLLVHMDDSLTSLHEAGSVRRVGAAVAPTPPGDLVGALRTRACQLLADWATEPPAPTASQPPGLRHDVLVAGRSLTSPVLTSAGALEVAVHGWDVAVACGVDRPLPGALALDLLRVAPLLVAGEDRPARFSAALPAGPAVSPGERLLAFLGRRAP